MEYFLKLILLIIPVFGFLFYFSQKRKHSFVIPAILYLILLIAISLFNVGRDIYRNYPQPPEWDFLVFWLDGTVAAHGDNFYEPQSYQAIPLPRPIDNMFQEEILDVGFKYPPFTMFLLLPLGWFSFSNAYLFWQILSLLFCLACIYTLWRIFLHKYGLLGLFLVAALLLRLSPTRDTFTLSQTNFLVMLLFLMFWVNRPKPLGGLWLALGMAVKPYMAVLLLYPLVKRNWRQIVVAISTLAGLTILSVIAFGPDVLLSFFNNPTSKVPDFLYIEIVNQSLLATILRANPGVLGIGSPVMNPLFLAISLTLFLITIWILFKNKDNNSDKWSVLALLFFALLIYPATLEHYSVFLIIPTALLLQQSNRGLTERLIAIFIIFAAYLVSGFNGSGEYSFYANAFMWIVCIVFAANLKLPEAVQSTAILEKTS